MKYFILAFLLISSELFASSSSRSSDSGIDPKCVVQSSTSSKPSYQPSNIVNTFKQPMTVEWALPTHRQNCKFLSPSELSAFYIIAVDTNKKSIWKSAAIKPGTATQYTFTVPSTILATTNHFEIAAEDTNGLVSDYAIIYPEDYGLSSSSKSSVRSSVRSSTASSRKYMAPPSEGSID